MNLVKSPKQATKKMRADKAIELSDALEAIQKSRQLIDQHWSMVHRALAIEQITQEEFDTMKANMNVETVRLMKQEAELEDFNADVLKGLYL